jgi:pyridoxamine 5'-phosphate oxidase
MDVGHLRREYLTEPFDRHTLDENPWQQFEKWFQQAVQAAVEEPNAMSLATVDRDGQPSLRTVLLKYFDEHGLVFFTNYESRKAQQIAVNPRVALLFFWAPLHRQVKVEGHAEKISTAESLRYFVSRPRGSQLGAWCSPQSTVISSRQILLDKLQEIKRKFGEGHIPLPSFWGGYRVTPTRMEFWQGGQDRLHDRFEYTRDDASQWHIAQLAP